MALQSLDISRRSASPTASPQARKTIEIAKLIDTSTCIGCKACQVACSEWNDIREEVGHNIGVYDNPTDLSADAWTVMRFAEEDSNGKLEWLIRKDGCMHCADPGCLKACPSPGAIIQYSNGIVDFHQENCIGCGYCISGCPFNVPRISKKDNKAYKCTLCSDRVSVGLEPACVKTCPTGAIQFGSKEDMKDVAATRVADLKTRGYANAGLYDPQGVGGTHVMYVLHHADKSGANLSRATLDGANLIGANLIGANLTGAALYDADLTRADLTKANLTKANLTGADLYEADLYGADLTKADLTKARIVEADLEEARFGDLGPLLHRATLGSAPSSGRTVFVRIHEVKTIIRVGCFSGTASELRARSAETHRTHNKAREWYTALCDSVEAMEKVLRTK